MKKRETSARLLLLRYFFPPSAIWLVTGSGGNLPSFPVRRSSPVWWVSQHYPGCRGFSQQQDRGSGAPAAYLLWDGHSPTASAGGHGGVLLLLWGWQEWKIPQVLLSVQVTHANMCGQETGLVGDNLIDCSMLLSIAVWSNHNQIWVYKTWVILVGV